jgi:hypothetical protein
MPQIGDLVLTPDGYYGIVINERQIRLGVGLVWTVEAEMWPKVRKVSVHESGRDSMTANFATLVGQSMGQKAFV